MVEARSNCDRIYFYRYVRHTRARPRRETFVCIGVRARARARVCVVAAHRQVRAGWLAGWRVCVS